MPGWIVLGIGSVCCTVAYTSLYDADPVGYFAPLQIGQGCLLTGLIAISMAQGIIATMQTISDLKGWGPHIYAVPGYFTSTLPTINA